MSIVGKGYRVTPQSNMPVSSRSVDTPRTALRKEVCRKRIMFFDRPANNKNEVKPPSSARDRRIITTTTTATSKNIATDKTTTVTKTTPRATSKATATRKTITEATFERQHQIAASPRGSSPHVQKRFPNQPLESDKVSSLSIKQTRSSVESEPRHSAVTNHDSLHSDSNNDDAFCVRQSRTDYNVPFLCLKRSETTKASKENDNYVNPDDNVMTFCQDDIDEYAIDLGLSTHRPGSQIFSARSLEKNSTFLNEDAGQKASQQDNASHFANTANYLDVGNLQSILGDENYQRYLKNCEEDDASDDRGSDAPATHNPIINEEPVKNCRQNFVHAWCENDDGLALKTHRPTKVLNAEMRRDTNAHPFLERHHKKDRPPARKDVHCAFSADQIYAEADHFTENYSSVVEKPVRRVNIQQSAASGRNIFESPSKPFVSQGQTMNSVTPTYRMESSEAVFEMSHKWPPTSKTHMDGIHQCLESSAPHGSSVSSAYTNTALKRYFSSLEGIANCGSDGKTGFEPVPEMNVSTKSTYPTITRNVNSDIANNNYSTEQNQAKIAVDARKPSRSTPVSRLWRKSENVSIGDEDDLTRVTSVGNGTSRSAVIPPHKVHVSDVNVGGDGCAYSDKTIEKESVGITERLRKLGIDFHGLKEKARNEISKRYENHDEDDVLPIYDCPSRSNDIFSSTGFLQPNKFSSDESSDMDVEKSANLHEASTFKQACPNCQSAVKRATATRCACCGCSLARNEQRADLIEHQNRIPCDDIVFNENNDIDNSFHSRSRSSQDFSESRKLGKNFLEEKAVHDTQEVRRLPQYNSGSRTVLEQVVDSATDQVQQPDQQDVQTWLNCPSRDVDDYASGANAFTQRLERSWEDKEFVIGRDRFSANGKLMAADSAYLQDKNSSFSTQADRLVASVPDGQNNGRPVKATDPVEHSGGDNAASHSIFDSKDDHMTSVPLRHQLTFEPSSDRNALKDTRRQDIAVEKILNASDPHTMPLPERKIAAEFSLQLGDSINSSIFDTGRNDVNYKKQALASSAAHPADEIDFEYSGQLDPRHALSDDMRVELSLNLRMSHDSSQMVSGRKLAIEHPPNDIQPEGQQPEAEDLIDEPIAVVDSNYTKYVSQIVDVMDAQPASNAVLRPQPSIGQPGRSRPQVQHGGSTEATSSQKHWPMSTTWSSSCYDKFARQSSSAKLARSRNGKSAKGRKCVNRNRERDSVDVSAGVCAEGCRQISRSANGEDLSKRLDNARKSRVSAMKAGRCSQSAIPHHESTNLVVHSSEFTKGGRLTKSVGAMTNKKTYSKYLSMAQGFTGRLYNRPSSATYRKQAVEDMSPRITAGELSIWHCLPDELILYIFSFLSHSHLAKAARTCRQFQRIITDTSLWHCIELRSRIHVTDAWLSEIGRHRPRSLVMSRCRGDAVTASGLRELFRETADCLKELRMTGCNEGVLTGDHILLHAASRCKNITHLDMSWSNANDNGIISISESSNALQSLSLNGCQLITDDAVSTLLAKHGQHLKTLELFGCFCLTSRSVAAIRDHCHGLVTLNLGHCWKLTDECIVDLCPSLTVLENLDLRGCKQITDASVRQIASSCSKLITLSLANCVKLTDISLVEISTNGAQIRSLDVYGCQRITNTGVKAIATCCQDLELIDLSSTGITHKSVSLLANYCAHRLKIVKVNFCKHITMCCLVKLAKNCHRLEKLFLYGVRGLRSLDEVQNSNPALWIET